MEHKPFLCYYGLLKGKDPVKGVALEERFGFVDITPAGTDSRSVEKFTAFVRHLYTGALMARVQNRDLGVSIPLSLRPPAIPADDFILKVYSMGFWMFEVALFHGHLDDDARLVRVGSTQLSTFKEIELRAFETQIFDSWPKPNDWTAPPHSP